MGTERGGWHGRQCVDGNGRLGQLVAAQLEATHVPDLQRKSSVRSGRGRSSGRLSTLPAAGAAGRGLAPQLPARLCGPHVLRKHRALPLVAARGRHFPARVPGRAAQSLSTSRSRNPFPFPHLQGQVLMNVPVH